MKRLWQWIIVIVIVACGIRSVVFVDEAEFVIVTQFGRPVRTLVDSGPKLKMFYQSALRIDRRLQVYDPRPSEFLAQGKKNIDLDVFVCWKVENPQAFIEAVGGDMIRAESSMHDIIWAKLAAKIGKNPLEALVSTDPAKHRLEEIMAEVSAESGTEVAGKYGVSIVDVGVKRLSLPVQVRESVFERMRSERAQLAGQYRAEGDREAMKIRAEADKEKTVVLAQAYSQAEKIRGQGEAEAARVYGNAHGKDPELFELLRTLDTYKKILDERTTLLLSSDSELLKYLTQPRKD
ncbi:MAG: protease modulator HflC [Lentisphaerae bacterium]|jgi:modulator of FtsH protease HflC|nr:protease modulator HflC [Lentisphaerota bacterium]MBT4817092.1 protease modulator HflC [Lentisphaerota bacterium]MBT5608533.1 protease modulator HflC [Lentisphaerota bacterium]MBT7060246.1 protease modulator HflC [Lentisphaerota bacterium]MBT7843250.1 protease modulator HflC [Lentisphaerota bacterium]